MQSALSRPQALLACAGVAGTLYHLMSPGPATVQAKQDLTVDDKNSQRTSLQRRPSWAAKFEGHADANPAVGKIIAAGIRDVNQGAGSRLQRRESSIDEHPSKLLCLRLTV